MSDQKKNYESFFERSLNTIKQKKDYSVFESISEYYSKIIEDTSSYYSRYEVAKKRASFYKYKALKDLHDHIIEFESKFSKSGGKVLYAENKKQALKEIFNILDLHKEKQVILSFEQILNNIGLYDELEKQGRDIFMLSLHSLYFSVHPNSFEDISKKLTNELNAEKFTGNSLDVLSLHKKRCQNKVYKDSISIMGADSLLPDIGGVVFLDNEGEKSIQHSYSKIQIIVAGIDQLLSSVLEIDLLNSLKSTHHYGDFFPWSQTIVTGPKKEKEIDGPEEVYVIWLDDGRSKVLGFKNQRDILKCIGCMACDAVCPVFKFVKSKDDRTHRDIDSPISCVVAPIVNGLDNSYLSFACTLCGKCQEVCPVNIPLSELILHTRKEAVDNGFTPGLNKSQMKVLKKMFLKRKSMESSYNKLILKTSGIKKSFGTQRIFPDFSQKSFHLLWSELSEIHTRQNA